jgi:hypothetical protein
MSNTQFSKESLIFQFLGTKEFLNLLIEKNEDPEVHNLLLSAHLLAIGFNTTGISEGGVNLTYLQQLSPIEEQFKRPNSQFHFYTTTNKLIEGTNYCQRCRISLKNSYFRANYTYDFRDFCTAYFDKHCKNIDLSYLYSENNEESFPLKGKPINTIEDQYKNKIDFRLRGRKRNSEEGQKYGYDTIVASNKTVRAYVESWYLEKELALSQDGIKQKKFKL